MGAQVCLSVVFSALPVAFQLALYFGVRRDADTAAALGGVYERLVRDVTLEARGRGDGGKVLRRLR